MIQCPACQAVKPGHEEEVKAKEEETKPTVSMGAEGGFKFSFGTPAATSNDKPAQSSSGFTFGTPTSSTKSSTDQQPAKSSPFSGFTFGNPAATGSASSSGLGNVQFSFIYFWTFPGKVFSFPVLGEFVYFWTFPGKIQSFLVFSEFVYFWTFPGKIQSFHIFSF